MSGPSSTPSPSPSAPPVLGYDAYTPHRDRRGFLRAWGGFHLGILVMCVARGLVLAVLLKAIGSDRMDAIDGVFTTLAEFMFNTMLVALILPIAIWVQQRLKRQTRFASLQGAMTLGALHALIPWNLIGNWWVPTPLPVAIFLPAFLFWQMGFPVLASAWLCYRSALRD